MVSILKNEKFIAYALKLATRGLGKTSPNPVVGCVVVKNEKIITGDYHHKAGEPHAEVLTLKKAGRQARGADLFITLEPCCTYGHTPPCTEAIIEAGIKRVYIGTVDPNPEVNGKGIKTLQKAGIETVVGILEERCRQINRVYNKYIIKKLPYVTIKYAQSIDGRIAAKTGSSQWISSEKSLKFAHKLRAQHDAILIGANTANTDNPQLTVRKTKGDNPIRIILTASGNIKKNLRMFSDNSVPTIIATSRKGALNFKNMKSDHVDIITLPMKSGKLDIGTLLQKLAQRKICSLLIEGGSKAITSFLDQKLADRIIVVTAPIIIGDGINAVGNLGIKSIARSLKFSNIKLKNIGSDYTFFGDLN